MEKEAILRILQEDIHSTIAATLGEDGHPQTRAIDIMLIEDGKPIFLTARGKAFYDQLTTQKFIALSGVKEGFPYHCEAKCGRRIRDCWIWPLNEILICRGFIQEQPGRRWSCLSFMKGRVRFSISISGRFIASALRSAKSNRQACGMDHSEVRRLRRLFECLSAAVY